MSVTEVTTIYCRDPDCPARESQVITKYGKVKEWRCPACGGPVVIHSQYDLATYERHALESAIGRVNAALYVRDRPQGLGGHPISVMMLAKLPEDWKAIA